MKKHPNFRPIVGSYWIETVSDDPFVISELKKLKLAKYLKKSKEDLTLYGKNKRLVLRHVEGDAILVWEKQRLENKKFGIRCLFFINNSQTKSLVLFKEAMKLARWCWIEYPIFLNFEPKFYPKDAEKFFRKCGWKSKTVTPSGLPVYTCDYKT
jgi:hypothetical protein